MRLSGAIRKEDDKEKSIIILESDCYECLDKTVGTNLCIYWKDTSSKKQKKKQSRFNIKDKSNGKKRKR